MKKKYSVILVIIMTLMVAMVTILSYSDRKKLTVNILKGSNKNLENISLIYNPGNSVFSSSEVKLSKDGLNTKQKLHSSIERDYIEVNEKYKDIVSFENASFYQNKNRIGKIEFTTDFEDEYSKPYLTVYEKNKETNKNKKTKINLKDKIFHDGYMNVIFSTVIKDDIYTVVNKIDSRGFAKNLYVIKINIKKEKCEVLNEYNFKESSVEPYIGDIAFCYNNKIYIEMQIFEDKKEYSNFLIYDIEKNNITKSNQFMNTIEKEGNLFNQNRFDYKIVDNKLNILIGDKYGNISTLVYEINDDNLKLLQNIKYNLNLSYVLRDSYNSQVKAKLIDDKIYSLVTSKTELSRGSEEIRYIDLEGVKPTEFTIFDINKNEIIYKSELLNGDKYRNNKLFFIKDFS